MIVGGRPYRTVWWESGALHLIDQTRLPFSFEVVTLRTAIETADAVRRMVVRGAPALSIAAGFGLVLAYRESADPARHRAAFEELLATRPTGRNLALVLERVRSAGQAGGADAALAEAQSLADRDVDGNRRIGEHGRPLIRDGLRVMTHCNAGWLATVDIGTQTAPLYQAHREGVRFHVLVNRTGPRDQGARLTAWELGQEGISHEIVEDSAAGFFMSRKEIDLVLVGADRIAANGDVANKIGTYPAALCAGAHNIPFYVAAPWETFDPACPAGAAIPIEERPEDEVLYKSGPDETGTIRRIRVAAPGSHARNPAFDITPTHLIRGIVTPGGIVPAEPDAIRRALAASPSRD